MRKLFSLLAVAALCSGLTFVAAAQDDKKEVTLEGEGVCAKCALNETPKCQNAVKVTKDGKETIYYFEANAVAKAFHGKVCQASPQIKVTGVVGEKDGKKTITASKAEVVK